MIRKCDPAVAVGVSSRSTSALLDYLSPRDPMMMTVQEHALRVAFSDETVLVLGETGVGKDVLARCIHEASPRAGGIFLPINCAAIADGLIDSELFGHERGAFTGAVESRPGQFELAAGGTLFLNEIGELSPHRQAKLLHVLQSRQFCRVGGRVPIETDVRVIAATNQDLEVAMNEGRFRRDLYYRLSVVSLCIPPLRERPRDLEALTRHFARKYADLYARPDLATPPDEVIVRLALHPFDGNVRELENLVKRAMLLGGYEEILHEIDRVSDSVTRSQTVIQQDEEPPFFASQTKVVPLKDVAREAARNAERRAILEALSATRWNRRKAARRIAISYRALLYKIRDYGLEPPSSNPYDLPVPGPRIYGLRQGSA